MWTIIGIAGFFLLVAAIFFGTRDFDKEPAHTVDDMLLYDYVQEDDDNMVGEPSYYE